MSFTRCLFGVDLKTVKQPELLEMGFLGGGEMCDIDFELRLTKY